MTETEQRQRVVSEARSWIGTPYHLNAQIKKVGVDCGTFLAAIFEGAGLIEHADLGSFKPDFHLHRSDEVYRAGLEKYCSPVTCEPQPGDILLYRFGRIASHGAVVTEWPRLIHAAAGVGVVGTSAYDTALVGRLVATYSFWGRR